MLISALKPALSGPFDKPGTSLEQAIRNLFANGEPGLWYDPSTASTVYQDSAGTTPGVFGMPAGLVLDKSGRGNHASQTTATARPVYTASPIRLDYDGIDDGLSTASFPAGTLSANMDCFIAIRRNGAGSGVIGVGDSTVKVFGYFQASGVGSTIQGCGLAVSTAVNGVAVGGATAKGDDLNAVLFPVWAIYEARNLDLSLWTQLKISGYIGVQLNGSIGPVILCPAQSDATRTQIRQALAAAVGVVLP